MRRLASAAVTATMAAAVVIGACNTTERSIVKGNGPSSSVGSGGMGGGIDIGDGGGCNIAGVCGNEIHELVFDAPNVYFVFDASGSMQALVPPSNETSFTVVREAAVDMIMSLGTLINVGAALFPAGNVQALPCSPGAEVFATTPGEPSGPNGQENMMVGAFRAATNVTPLGGTPIASTLAALQPGLAALEGRTIVLLLTDGGPNCNQLIGCAESMCMPHIEGACAPGEDCCAQGNMMYGPLLCVDQSTTVMRIEALKDLGIDVYTIGITGSGLYASVLDAMAVAGGTELSGSPKYHAVDDLSLLTSVFAQIAASAISCEFPLADPPTEPGFTNVYFGCDVVTYDPAQGWDWLDEGTVKLNGAACQQLKSGQVSQVTIATGCPTELPK